VAPPAGEGPAPAEAPTVGTVGPRVGPCNQVQQFGEGGWMSPRLPSDRVQ
jgi:hypothetical protein